MRSSKVNNFIPSYPLLTDKNLNYDLFRKKELYELKLNQIQDEKEKVGGLFKEQEYIARFISNYTPYDGILLTHATGTGKSCAFFGATEEIRDQKNFVIFDKAVVLAPTPLILENLKRNLVEKCSSRYPEPDALSKLKKDPFYSFIPFSQPKFIDQLKESVRGKVPIIIIDEVHRITSDEKEESKFYSLINTLHSIPSKKIILGSATPMVNSYTQIFKVMALLTPFPTPPTKKVIQDFEKKYNSYILKKNNIIYKIQEPLLNLFKGRVSYLRKSIDIQIRNITNPSIKTNLTWSPENDPEWNFKFTKEQLQLLFNEWFMCEMSGLQNSYYVSKMVPKYKDEKTTGISLSKNMGPMQASLFVFPKLKKISKPLIKQNLYYNPNNKMIIMSNRILPPPYEKLDEEDIKDVYSKTANKVYTFYEMDITEAENKNSSKNFIDYNAERKTFKFKSQIVGYRGNRNSSRMISIIGSPLKKILEGKTQLETLNNIKPYSILYYNILKSIIDNPREKHFVYVNLVSGSGALLLCLLLNLLNYRRYTKSKGIPSKKTPSYMLLVSAFTDAQKNKKLIEIFNHSSNKYGEYIQVIVGGKAISTGIDLKHIRHIHIATPDWNYTTTDQAKGRGIRSGSHAGLKPEEKNVSIYHYVPLPQKITKLNYIIDARMYIRSFYKDLNIKQIDYFMKVNAVNCPVFYKRNYIDEKSKDFTKMCAYKKCDYKCNNIPIEYLNETLHEYILPKDKIDTGNTLLFLNGKKEWVPYIYKCFRHSFILHYDELKIQIERQLNQTIDNQMLLYTLYEMIENQIPIIDLYGFENYLNEQHHHFYLDRSPYRNKMTNSFYQDCITLPDPKPIISNPSVNQINDIFRKIINAPKNSDKRKLMYQIPHTIRIIMLKALLTKYNKPNSWLLNYFKFDYFRMDGMYYIRNVKSVKTIKLSEDPCKTPDKIRYNIFYECFNPKLGKFGKCDETQERKIKQFRQQENNKFLQRAKNIGFYGIYTKNIFEKPNFKILKLKEVRPVKDKRDIKTGKKCMIFSQRDVSDIIKVLKLNPVGKLKATKCNLIFEYLNTLNLISDETYTYNPDTKQYEFIYLES